jgi:hypothetical protein
MKMFVPIALLALPLPAQAADLATLGCVEETLPLTIRAQLVLDAERNLNETGARPSYDPSVVEALKTTTVACATKHGWPQTALQSATLYARARVAWPVAQRIASEKGLDPAVLETVWLALPEDQRNVPLTVDNYRELADAAIPEGEQRTREMGEFISEFFQLLSVMQYSSYAFSQD